MYLNHLHIEKKQYFARNASFLFDVYPANKKRFWNIWVWLYEGLVELNVVGT